jgi:membrane protease YdiL (CAAX protease family)
MPVRLPARGQYPGPWLRSIDVAACIIVAAILVLGLDRAIINFMARSGPIEEIHGYIAWGAAYSLSLIGTVWFVFAIIRRIPIADFGGAASDRRAKLLALCWGLVGIAVSWAAFAIADEIIEWDRDHSFGLGPTTTLAQVGTLFLFVAILGPLAEELMYRGVLFRWPRQRLSFWPAAIASSLFFGIVHQYWDAIINATIAGVFFAWLFERTKSLLVPIIAHQAWNAVWLIWTWIDRAS